MELGNKSPGPLTQGCGHHEPRELLLSGAAALGGWKGSSVGQNYQILARIPP